MSGHHLLTYIYSHNFAAMSSTDVLKVVVINVPNRKKPVKTISAKYFGNHYSEAWFLSDRKWNNALPKELSCSAASEWSRIKVFMEAI